MKPTKHLSMIRSFHLAAILIYFVVRGVSRLARYNLTAERLAQGSDKVRYFEGTPIHCSLLLVIAALSGSLMISRTPHFRNSERFAVDFPTANTGPYDS